jgi:PPP family 3-phenylpropionic acid transporter
MKKMFYPFSFYVLLYGLMASFVPFMVLYYQQLNFSGVQIGIITGVPPLITLAAAPFLTGIADTTRRHTLIMGIGILMTAITTFMLPMLSSFTAIFLLVLLFNIFFSPVSSLSDSAVMFMLGDERAKYGRIRLGGTIGWGVFAQIAGFLLYRYGLSVLFYVCTAIALVNFFFSRKLAFGKPEEHISNPGSVWTFLTNRRWIFFLLSVLIGGLGAVSVASYLSPYLKDLGANGKQIGFAITIATVTEVPVFFFGNSLVKRFGSDKLISISLVLIVARTLLFGIVNTVFLAIVVQGIGGLFFPAMWSACVTYADEHAPAGLKSTAQGILGTATFGVGSSIGGLICGPLLVSLGGRGMFLVLGIIMAVGLGLIETLKRILPEKPLPQPVSVD